MKIIYTMLTLASLGYGYWYMGEKHPEVKQKIEQWVDFRSFECIEARYSAEQILENRRSELLKESGSKYLASDLVFYPYLLMEIKYSKANSKTKEAAILWDLYDGEMILSTKHWKKTHGFADLARANVQQHEFKVINALIKKGASADLFTLSKELVINQSLLESWLKTTLRKNLIVSHQGVYRLHMEKPQFTETPETNMDERLATRSVKQSARFSKEFSRRQIEKTAHVIFGGDFTILRSVELYLPVFAISIKKSDGATRTTYWNGFNGKRFSKSSFFD